MRQADGLYIVNVVTKASMRVEISLGAFTCRNVDFMQLCVSYVRPQLEYAAAVWSPHDVASTSRLVLVQRRFTKHITGFYHLSCRERLERLQLLSLKFRRVVLIVCFINKILHNTTTPESIGL